jgi:hypothetical protein
MAGNRTGSRLAYLPCRCGRFVVQDMSEAIPVADTKGALAAFIRIGEDPDRVLRFARRYGVLGLCKHGKPVNHNPPDEDGSGGCKLPGDLLFGRFEPLERWFHFGRQARTLIDIAATLRGGSIPRKEDWEIIFEDSIAAGTYTPWVTEPVPSFDKLWFRLSADRTHKGDPEQYARARNWLVVAMVVNEWLRMGAVRPWMTYSESGVDLRMLSDTFGVLAMQLAAGVSSLHGIAKCSGCGEAYARKTAIQRGRRNFCNRCGKRESAKLRQRDLKLRRRNGG